MELKKIQEFVVANGIKPRDCLYHTFRDAKNKKMEAKGKIRVLATKDNVARAEYICPECGHYAYTEQEWKRPFYVKCEKCGFRLGIPKMRQEFKKEQKAESKK